jgi:hypothetical protein
VQLLGALGIGEDVKPQALFAAILQPLLDREPVALGLGNLLALAVEEQLVDQAFGLLAAEHARDLVRLDA